MTSVNTSRGLPIALSSSGSNTTNTGNDQAFGSFGAPSLLDWLGLRPVAGGGVSAVLDPQPRLRRGDEEQSGNELEKGGLSRLLELVGGEHPIGNQGALNRPGLPGGSSV
jgi:hypothetical protein